METPTLWNLAAPALASLVASLLLIPLAGRLARHAGIVSQPRPDRWGGQPTPMMGGVAVFTAIAVVLPFFLPGYHRVWWIVATAAGMMVFGLWDDKFHIMPQTKLVGQIVAACLIVLGNMGFTVWPLELFNVLLSIFWVVAVINAVNLMDNMDGLAPGVALIATAYMVIILGSAGKIPEAILASALGGALIGFLAFNFPPAKIYLGDSGSLSIGIILAALTLSTAVGPHQKLGAFSILLGPALVMAIPLLDVTLVSITRILSGKSISEGGRDHTSHRLVRMGLSERKTVLVLYVLAALAGGGGLYVMNWASIPVSLTLIPLIWVGLGLFFVYISQSKMEEKAPEQASPDRFSLILGMAFKRRILEVVMDLGLAFTCFCLAYLLRFDFHPRHEYIVQIQTLLPWVLGGTLVAFQVSGLYSGVWRHKGLRDIQTWVQAAVFAAGLTMAVAVFLYRFERFPRSVFPIYGILLFLGVAATRISAQLLEIAFSPGAADKDRVIIFGTHSAGMGVFHQLNSLKDQFLPVAFIDEDPDQDGLKIHGLPVIGGGDFERLEQRIGFDRIILAEDPSPAALESLRAYARSSGKQVIRFKIVYESIV